MEKRFELRLFGRTVIERRSGEVQKLIRNNFLSQIYGSLTKTGKMVNDKTALGISAVWSCIQVYSNTMAMVPLNVYERDGDSRKVASNHPYHILIHSRPNVLMTSFTWRRTAAMQCASTGNSYTLINRNGHSGLAESLELIPKPNNVEPYLIDGKVWYDVKGLKDPVPAENMIHFMWNSTTGLKGMSPIEIARENIGQAVAMQEYGPKIYSEGGAKRPALKSPSVLTDAQRESWKKTWKEKYGGLENLHEVGILEGGADLVEIGMNPDDAQFVESMKFKIEEIARIFNIPLHMIQSMDHATNNNIEHQGMDFVTHTMMPHFVNWEQELDYKLFRNDPKYYTKHNVNSLLRGDAKTRAAWYRAVLDLGIMTINEARSKEDMDPVEGGDTHFVQVNRTPLEKALQGDDPTRSLATEATQRTNGHSKKETVTVN